MDSNKKLAYISETMADGYWFLQVRGLIEKMEMDAANGDNDAEQIVKVMERFYNLCKYVRK